MQPTRRVTLGGARLIWGRYAASITEMERAR